MTTRVCDRLFYNERSVIWVWPTVYVLLGALLGACSEAERRPDPPAKPIIQTQTSDTDMSQPVNKTDQQWRESLTPMQYHVLREKGTERAFTGEYHDHKGHGVYRCAGCGLELFKSDEKFDSGTGWPSYWSPADDDRVVTKTDTTHGMTRTEVLCRRCGGHLGHIFNDGPAPTGLRYCINSASLDFKPGGTGDTE